MNKSDFKKLMIEKITSVDVRPGDILMVRTPKDKVDQKTQMAIMKLFNKVFGARMVQVILYHDEIDKIEKIRIIQEPKSKIVLPNKEIR